MTPVPFARRVSMASKRAASREATTVPVKQRWRHATGDFMESMTRTRMVVALGLMGIGANLFLGCAGESAVEEDGLSQDAISSKALDLTPAQRTDIVTKKATCPFVGTTIALKKVAVYGTQANPFAVIKDFAAVVNRGGGDLGLGFEVVARGNHHQSPVSKTEAPAGMFSLHFPSSVGAHAAHSFILMGNPRDLDSGGLNRKNLELLLGRAETTGDRRVVRRAELGRFVADNVACDPNAVSASKTPFGIQGFFLGSDIFEFKKSEVQFAANKFLGEASNDQLTKMLENLLRIAVRNNLIGSAAEFGLLTTFLEGSDQAVKGLDPGLAVTDIEAIYAGEKRPDGSYDPATKHFPANWESQPKTILAFLRNTVAILTSATTQEALNAALLDGRSHGACPSASRDPR